MTIVLILQEHSHTVLTYPAVFGKCRTLTADLFYSLKLRIVNRRNLITVPVASRDLCFNKVCIPILLYRELLYLPILIENPLTPAVGTGACHLSYLLFCYHLISLSCCDYTCCNYTPFCHR